ncbi:hypothetical protein PR202_ga03141 [Eleusine coracana subsp. coracana]|uniref:F-box domain-containing protein n=1 Tax=Eleusine coracana subsp. coracana TaxID=191504 RepID=A0AAV5BLB1_ELECO|nr:hypothetical protein PR202_ga03141 [Eleusine coracana subsp. coracana]
MSCSFRKGPSAMSEVTLVRLLWLISQLLQTNFNHLLLVENFNALAVRHPPKRSMKRKVVCEISRLPRELLAAALARSFTTPPEAARAAIVSRDFRAAADSDDVWANFLPGDLPPLASGEEELVDDDSAPPSSKKKKEMFLRLTDHPVLLANGFTVGDSSQPLIYSLLFVHASLISS